MPRPEESVVHGSQASRSAQALAQPHELPALDRLLRLPSVAVLIAEHGHTLVAAQARQLLGELREQAVAGTLDGFELADLDLQERREGDVLGLNQSGRAGHLRFLSLADHQEVIESARAFCQAAYAQNPDDPGMSALAAQFVDTDRVEYLDKA